MCTGDESIGLTACNPDFRRTKLAKVRGIISILMWTWKFSPPCYCVKIVDCQSGHLKINFPTEKILLCLISSIESWLTLSEFRSGSKILRNVRFDEINLNYTERNKNRILLTAAVHRGAFSWAQIFSRGGNDNCVLSSNYLTEHSATFWSYFVCSVYFS